MFVHGQDVLPYFVQRVCQRYRLMVLLFTRRQFYQSTEFHHCQERAYNNLRRICTYHRARHFWWIRHTRRCHRVDQVNELRNQSTELLFGGDRPDHPSSLYLIMGSSVTLSRFFLDHPPTSFPIIMLMMGPSRSIAFTLHFDQSDIKLWSLASNLIIGELFPILSYLFRFSPQSLSRSLCWWWDPPAALRLHAPLRPKFHQTLIVSIKLNHRWAFFHSFTSVSIIPPSPSWSFYWWRDLSAVSHLHALLRSNC